MQNRRERLKERKCKRQEEFNKITNISILNSKIFKQKEKWKGPYIHKNENR